MTDEVNNEPAPAEHELKNGKRAEMALSLRLAGSTFRDIAKQLGYRGPSGAHQAVAKLLDESRREKGDQLIELQLARLERLLSAVWGRAITGDSKAVARAESLIAQINRMLGLNAPDKVDVEVRIREYARANGLDEDEAVREAMRTVKEHQRA